MNTSWEAGWLRTHYRTVKAFVQKPPIVNKFLPVAPARPVGLAILIRSEFDGEKAFTRIVYVDGAGHGVCPQRKKG